MEPILVLLGLALATLPIVTLVLAIISYQRTGRLQQALDLQEADIRALRAKLDERSAPMNPPAQAPAPEEKAVEIEKPAETPKEIRAPVTEPPPIPFAVPEPVLLEAVVAPELQSATVPEPVELPPPVVFAEPAPQKETEHAGINWEQFMGVKMFAWLGGLALFLGVAFFIKYSFDQGLISPPIRVAMGFLTGIGLLVGGLRMSREKYAVTIQALCSAGILILFADVFASFKFYHFIPSSAAFGLMVLVTATAFLLAVRLDAQAVAILGLLGGFLTPVLLSTGEDHPVGLFGYLGILDIGLIAVALNKRWNYMALLAAIATVIMQAGWADKFYAAEKMPVAMCIFIAFPVLFTAALGWAERNGRAELFASAAALLMPASALFFAFYLLDESRTEIAAHPGRFFSFVFAADLALLAASWIRRELRWANLAAGAVVFILQAAWMTEFLKPETLEWSLGFCLLFAILHSAFPAVAERLRPAGSPQWWSHFFAPLALLLLMIPIFRLETLSILIWPVVLLVDLIAIVLTVVTMSIIGLIAVLLFTVVALTCWIFRAPAILTGLPEMLFLIGGFAVFFFAAGLFAARKLAALPKPETSSEPQPPSGFLDALRSPEALAAAPAMSAVLPFFLLTFVILQLPLVNPTPVFGLAALMLVMLLGLVKFTKIDWLAAMGLLGVAAVESVWYFRRFDHEHAMTPLLWHTGFYALFALFPFLFQKQFANRIIPWAVAALAAPFHFWIVHEVIRHTWPNSYMGLLPAAFAIPPLLSLVQLVRTLPRDAEQRNALLAIFGGVALFFITLIFPIQFDRQWITIGWALEGAALLWLFHRIPHDGLRLVGTLLLLAAFARLSPLNMEQFSYQPRSATPIWNWYLYAYGIVTLCLYAGARLLARPRNVLLEINIPPILWGLGTLLAFLLLNIEIADWFSTGPRIEFQFSGSFGRDMTYSIAWALFAALIMIVGIARRLPALRYGGIALLLVTILKLFLHDLWSLGGLYRIASLIGLALVLIPVSYLYQRFLAPAKKPEETRHEP